MSATYKQEIKDKSRTLIWQHAVESLTKKREESRILNKTYLAKLSDYVENKSGRIIDPIELYNYNRYLDISYGQRGPEELKGESVDKTYMWKLIIPREGRKEMYEYINRKGVNAASLFPGYGGVVKCIQETRAF